MEIWKNIPDYENYQISNSGKIKSLNYKRTGVEKILKQTKNTSGYLSVGLLKKGNQKTFTIHQLVAVCFLSHKINGHNKVVNHINFNREDNRVENLELISNRENCNKKHLCSSSKYVGVSFHSKNNKWLSGIRINGKTKYLGYYDEEYDAHLAYQYGLSKTIL